MLTVRSVGMWSSVALLVTALASAQGSRESQQNQPQTQQHQMMQGGMMGMMGMMEQCRTQCQRMRGTNSDLRKTVEEARQSNDPQKMRAALDQVQKSLGMMNEHMSQCMRAMNSMGGMHQGMQGGKSEPKKNDGRQ